VTDLPDRLVEALKDRYTLQRELGSGGMATVYLATDVKHRRPVALKVLRPELAAALGPDRFLREIQFTARLNHPHILPLLDSGEAGGCLYYVMPYAEGESLRDRLSREKQLPVEDALQVAREVADALDYAHAHTVVHRDIKPENILVQAHHAVVADFGIAKAISAAGGEKLTATGVTVGTPEYMSPEQAGGRGQLDGRSDIYALGCVLYEMLAGQPPFTGPTVESVVRQHLTATPPAVSAIRSAVPTRVTSAIQRSLAKAPADRYATASQFGQALSLAPRSEVARWRRLTTIVAIVGAVVVVGLGGYLATHRPPQSPAGPSVSRLVVLPFQNLGAPEDEFFADGITDEITNRLVADSGLDVISRTSAYAFKGQTKTLREIADALGDVSHVLEGTIRTDRGAGESSQVRVTAQLIRVADDTHLWSEGYSAALVPGQVFAVQAQIAERVAQALDVRLLERVRPERPTENLAAYEEFLRGAALLRQCYQVGCPEGRRAAEHFVRATGLDPAFALAHAAASITYSRAFSGASFATKAKEAADLALWLDPDLALGHVAVGQYYYYRLRFGGASDYQRAQREFELAYRSEPGNVEVLRPLGLVRRRLGDWPGAVALFAQVADRDPLEWRAQYDAGVTYLFMRQYDEAERYYDRAISGHAPGWGIGYADKALLQLLRSGDVAKARAVLQGAQGLDWSELCLYDEVGPVPTTTGRATAPRLFCGDSLKALERALNRTSRGDSPGRYYLRKSWLYGRLGNQTLAQVHLDSALAFLRAAAREDPRDAQPHIDLATSYAMLSRKDSAIGEMRRAIDLAPLANDVVNNWRLILKLAALYAQFGEPDAAVEQLDRVLSIPAMVSAPLLRVDPLWDPLRNHTRFQALLAKYEATLAR